MILPGNPNPAQLAEADRKVAAVIRIVDALLKEPLPLTDDQTATTVLLAYGPIVDAVIAVEDEVDRRDSFGAAVAIASELLRRLLTERDGKTADV